jgi:proteasome lid subunit RPN8/RPN11
VIVFASDIHGAMIAHCLREAPLEACGLLSGIAPLASVIHPLRNRLASEVRYDADPKDLIDAITDIRRREIEILAIYHSHPKSAAFPSKVDLAQNHYADLPRIIVSLRGETPEVRVWRLGEASYEELPWQVAVEPDASNP